MHLVDQAVADQIAAWRSMTDALERAWLEVGDGFAGGVTGIPVAPCNLATAYGDQDRRGLAELLGRVRASGLPYSLRARPHAAPAVAELAAQHEMVAADPLPLMLATAPPALEPPPELTIRRLAPDEHAIPVGVLADAFEVPPEIFRALVTPRTLSIPDVRCYCGELEGRPVVAASSHRIGESVAIFNVGTAADARGRGYGAALTALAAREGFEAGARFSWLQSSPLGLSVYRRLGYGAVESWSNWISPGRPA